MQTTVVVLMILAVVAVQQAAKPPAVKVDTSKPIKIMTPPYKRPDAIIPGGSGAKGAHAELMGEDGGAREVDWTGREGPNRDGPPPRQGTPGIQGMSENERMSERRLIRFCLGAD